MTGEFPPDAPIERIRRHLVGLRMPRALETLDHLVQQIERGQLGTIEAIEMLLAEELTIRETRRIKAALQMARLSVVKTLSGFDFAFQPSLDRNRILALAQLDFIDRHEVVHLIGQSGTGWRSHSASKPSVPAAASTSPRLPTSSTASPAPIARDGCANASAISVALSCSSSMRSVTSASGPVPAICSSNWSTPATRRAP